MTNINIIINSAMNTQIQRSMNTNILSISLLSNQNDGFIIWRLLIIPIEYHQKK